MAAVDTISAAAILFFVLCRYYCKYLAHVEIFARVKISNTRKIEAKFPSCQVWFQLSFVKYEPKFLMEDKSTLRQLRIWAMIRYLQVILMPTSMTEIKTLMLMLHAWLILSCDNIPSMQSKHVSIAFLAIFNYSSILYI
jgi:hypothetical protein